MINSKSDFRRLIFGILIMILSISDVVSSKCFATAAPSITIYCTDVYPCPGTPAVFTAIASNAGSNPLYQWQVNGINSGTNSTTFSFPNSLDDPIKPTDVIQCIVTNQADGQSTVSNKLSNINVVTQPTLIFNIFSQITLPVCSGVEIDFGTQYSNLDENHINNLMGVWRVNGVVVHSGLTFTSTTLKDGDVVSCTGTYSLKCFPPVDVKAVDIKVSLINSAAPVVTITPVSATGCINSEFAFKAALTNGGSYNTYQWTVNGSNAGDNSDTFASSTLQTGDKVVCHVRSITGCANYNIESNQVSVTTLPQQTNSVMISSDALNNFIEPGQQVTFTAQADYLGNISYQWMVNGVNAGTNSNVFTNNTLTIGDVVTCKVTTADACVLPATAASNAILMLMHVLLKIPNIFTPNDDGINDKWVINALLIYPTCTVKVFDRYGSMVFNSIGYTNAWTGVLNGKRLPTGVYYYVINLNNGTAPFSGYVTIVR